MSLTSSPPPSSTLYPASDSLALRGRLAGNRGDLAYACPSSTLTWRGCGDGRCERATRQPSPGIVRMSEGVYYQGAVLHSPSEQALAVETGRVRGDRWGVHWDAQRAGVLA